MPHYHRALFLFHRDLRLHDNTGLLAAHREADEVLPCFIFDERQIETHRYKSIPGLQFMVESLEDLSLQCQERGGTLILRRGITIRVLKEIIHEFKIEAVYCNRDYTPFARARDNEIAELCHELQVGFHLSEDSLLFEPEQIKKDDGRPYTVFTPFLKKCSSFQVNTPIKNQFSNFVPVASERSGETTITTVLPSRISHPLIQGGRTQAKNLLNTLSRLSRYKIERDFPSIPGTSKLSAHNKFGTCSIREVYYCIARELGPSHELIRQLHWRDFFSHIAFHFPHVFGHAFHRSFDLITWDEDETKFLAWCEGRTGFPIVDAGMRELNATGYMHNRVRMITGSFLIKDLHIDWRRGEQYFAQKLVDYDPAVNNGSWQWVASTGCDAQPYFRIFNPWLQQLKFDPEGTYIDTWIPELREVPRKILHQPPEDETPRAPGYPCPIVDHSHEKRVTEERYSAAKSVK